MAAARTAAGTLMSLAAVASYTWGQCTYYAAKTLDWVLPGWGNANQWAGRAAAQGYQVNQTPSIGAVATFDRLGAFGHVAVVENVSADLRSITVGEMNWKGVGMYSSRTIPVSSVSEFIHPKGEASTLAATTPGPLGYPDWTHAILGPLADFNPQDLLARAVLVLLGVTIAVLGLTILGGREAIQLTAPGAST